MSEEVQAVLFADDAALKFRGKIYNQIWKEQ